MPAEAALIRQPLGLGHTADPYHQIRIAHSEHTLQRRTGYGQRDDGGGRLVDGEADIGDFVEGEFAEQHQGFGESAHDGQLGDGGGNTDLDRCGPQPLLRRNVDHLH